MHGLFVRRVYSGLAAAGGWREPNARIVKIPMSPGRRATNRHHKPWAVGELQGERDCVGLARPNDTRERHFVNARD